MRQVMLTGALALLAAPAAAAAAPGQVPAVVTPLTPDQWRADLRFMAEEMRARHANLYHAIGRDEFAAMVARLDARIPELKRNQIIVEMMRIAAAVRDGHTRIDPRKDKAFAFPSLPLKLYDFSDGIYVRAAGPGHEALLGARVEAVGGVPIAEARGRIEPLVSADNQMAARTMVPLYLAMPDILQALGLATATDGATLTLSRGGKRWTVTIAAEGVDPPWPPDTDISLVTPAGWSDARSGPLPLWLEQPLVLHRLVAQPERGLVYAQLNQGTDYEGETIDAFGKRIAALARSANPRALVFDLRLNYGGNGDLRSGLVRDLIRAEDEDTRLFVLTGRGSFSATQFYLEDLARLSQAVVVGEPAAGKPTSYGDAYRSVMPNSGITVRTSIAYWQNGSDRRPWTPVDLAVPYAFADYQAGRDPVLEAALAYRPQPGLLQRLDAAAVEGGAAAATAALAAWEADPVHRYADLQGDALVAIQRMSDPAAALGAARWLAARFPDQVNPQTLRALLAERMEHTEEALAAAKAALALDPNQRQSRSVVERLTTPD